MLDGQLSGDILSLQIMKEYGWDYHTYMNQPTWILELAHQKYSIEAKLAVKAAEQPRHAE